MSAIGDARGVDLNSAGEQDLEPIGGIGRERARRIVEQRPFRSWDDLGRLEGFSKAMIDDLKRSGATLGRPGHA